MPNIKFIEKKITDLFIPKGGNSEYTKTFCNENKGECPVYSSSNVDIFNHINKYDFEGEYLTWSIVGFAGYIKIINGKFSITNNRGILLLKEDIKDIDLSYMRYILEPIFRKNKRGREGHNGENEYTTLNATAIKNIKETIPIPIKEDGSYDLERQKEIANKYKVLENQKTKLISYKKTLEDALIKIDLNESYNFIDVPLTKIFDLSQSSNSSEFTKTFIKNNKGSIPVYGASKFEHEVGYGYVKDNAKIIKKTKTGSISTIDVKYFNDCLTYNIDGTAGFIFYRKGRFSLSEKVKPLIIFDEYKSVLDIHYLKYMMQPIFRDKRKGREGHDGENEFTKLSTAILKALSIPIPIKPDGTYDLDTQIQIAKKYRKIEEIKNNVCKKIDDAVNTEILLK